MIDIVIAWLPVAVFAALLAVVCVLLFAAWQMEAIRRRFEIERGE